VCGRKLTIGVEHRVEELADRPVGFRPQNARPFENLAPLPEVIAASTGIGAASKKTLMRYEELLRTLGPEFYILREAPIEEIERAGGPCLAEGIRRLRLGQVERRAGFDGEYGFISLLTPSEIERLERPRPRCFGVYRVCRTPAKRRPALKKAAGPAAVQPLREGDTKETLNPEQQQAVCACEPTWQWCWPGPARPALWSPGSPTWWNSWGSSPARSPP
jgi:hypothetical protein